MSIESSQGQIHQKMVAMSWLDTVCKSTEKLRQKLKSFIDIFILALLIFVVVLLITNLFIYSVGRNENLTQQKHQSKQILAMLGDLEGKLQANTPATSNLLTLQQMVREVRDDIQHLQAREAQGSTNRFGVEIAAIRKEVNEQFQQLKNSLDIASVSSAATLNTDDAKVLPFKVVSLDVISGAPYVFTNIDNHVTPMMEGDSLAGWQLTEADYVNQNARFKNAQGQTVNIKVVG